MKALVKAKPEPGLWLQDVPAPEVGINDVLIRIYRTAICGTDVHIYNWDEWAQKTIPVPIHTGHEFAGRIVEIGSNVHGFKPGNLVSGEGHVVCGRCRHCLAGQRHLCANTSSIGVNRCGAFAEYICIPATNVWHADSNVPMDILSCFDPLGNATHTALSFNVLGEDILITGAGPIGCMAAAVAKYAGARHVVVTDVIPYRLNLARIMGATLALDVRTESIEDARKKLGIKEGFEVGFEMSGNPQALQSMLANMDNGGKIAVLGLIPQSPIIDWDAIILKSIMIKGIYGREMYETWYKMSVMIQNGLDITPVITHHFHYTDFEKGFEVMRAGQSGKVILHWRDD